MEIPLTYGRVAIIDDEDAPLVAPYNWHVVIDGNMYYATRMVYPQKKYVLMHRVIMGITDSRIRVDHKDRDGLNNRRSNLREATNSQNALNAVRPTGNESRYIGVRKSGPRWRARASYDGERFELGSFDTQEEAARAYDAFNRERNPGFAILNFPD